jgi:hypothetical protein
MAQYYQLVMNVHVEMSGLSNSTVGFKQNEFCIDPMSARYRVPTHSGDGTTQVCKSHLWSYFCDQTIPVFSGECVTKHSKISRPIIGLDDAWRAGQSVAQPAAKAGGSV